MATVWMLVVFCRVTCVKDSGIWFIFLENTTAIPYAILSAIWKPVLSLVYFCVFLHAIFILSYACCIVSTDTICCAFTPAFNRMLFASVLFRAYVHNMFSCWSCVFINSNIVLPVVAFCSAGSFLFIRFF